MSRKEWIFAVLLLSVQAAGQAPVPVVQNPLAGANQNIIQSPGTVFSANNEAGIVYAVGSYNWLPQMPPGMLTGGVSNTVTLNPCPAGLLVLSGPAPFTRIWVAGGGNKEAVVVTFTDCPLQGGGSHTVRFIPVHNYANGYTLSSASQGIQEAINAANSASTNFSDQLGKVIIPPGDYTALARISILGHKQYIDANGAVLTCTMADTCVFVGDVGGGNNANATFDVTIDGLAVRAGLNGGRYPAIEDDGQHTTLRSIGTRDSSMGNPTFSSIIQIDNDQSAVIEKLDPSLGRNWAHCGTDWCSVAIYGPGPFGTNAGVLWVKDSVISAQCGFNGIDNQDANALRVSDTIVQGYPQFGIRATGNNNNVVATLDNVHLEIGSCNNPLGTGIAGFISEGFTSVMHGTAPAGQLPKFGTGNTGPQFYAYYVVVKSTVGSTTTASSPYLAGYAPNSAPSIPVKWQQVGNTGTITYDLLRQTVTDLGANAAAPYGNGNFAVQKGITTANCSNSVCSFTDTGAVTTNYTVTYPATYDPALTFWPGSVVLTEPTDQPVNNGGEPRLYTDIVGQNGITTGGYVNSYGANVPTVFAHQCSVPGAWSSIWMSCPAGDSVSGNYAPVGALLLQAGPTGNSGFGGFKGRLNFLTPSNTSAATHLITLGDSNPAKTLATSGHRPTNDVNDTWIGLDNPNALTSGFQLAFGAPQFISSYIGNIGDNTNWLERLTSTTKTFGSTIQIVSTLPTNLGPPFSVVSTAPVINLTVSNHPKMQNCVTGTGTFNCAGTATQHGQIVFGTLNLSGGTATLQNLNPPFTGNANCVANDTTTVTNGVKVVPQSNGTIIFTGTGSDSISYQCVGS
ncbi:MAG TPA: hypothetical protein VN948_20380 [Terriglobales bacterium]|nr:hypothetical protein [Terriglobales bacterium]